LTRNALIIAIGFTPLFLSSLVPYVVVGAFLAAIIVLSWLVTIVGLPAVTSSVRRT
jgi:predicted RND superfamily exporter protein